MRKSTIFASAFALTLSASPLAHAELGSVDGVFAIRPATDSAYVAVAIEQGPGAALSGLSWFHNDQQTAFPRLVLMEGQAGSPPDLANSALILEELSGESLAWGSVSLEGAVTSGTGLIYAVFQFPTNEVRSGEGTGGGPGMGYRQVASGSAPAAYISADGVSWDRVRRDYEVPVEPSWSTGKMAPRLLSEIAAERHDEETVALSGSETEEFAKAASAAQPLRVAPNPFNPRTVISLYLPAGGQARVDVIDLRGRRVASLLSAELPSGRHTLIWEGTDGRGIPVASGVYWIRTNLAGTVHTRRISLLR